MAPKSTTALMLLLSTTCSTTFVAHAQLAASARLGEQQWLDRANNDDLPLAGAAFEENKGQVKTTDGNPAPYVRYRLSQGGTNIFLLGNGMACQFDRSLYPDGYQELMLEKDRGISQGAQMDAMRDQVRLETYRMDMVLEGADPNARITSEGRSSDYINYYNHNALDVHTYDRITYHEVYPGIDWVVYTNGQGIKHDLVLRPGADPSAIRIRLEHYEELSLDEEGNLIHGNRLGRFIEQKPISFQNGKEVPTRFLLEGSLLRFVVDDYDASKTLRIDPVRLWASYYGGADYDAGYQCTIDGSGNVYMAGKTFSTSAIAAGGYQNTKAGDLDAFLVKFNASGQRLWGTYYGGLEIENGNSCAVDANGNVYLAGRTESASGIASGGHQNIFGGGDQDAFLVKFDPSGVRQWGSYYGGTEDEQCFSCAVDGSGNVYLSGGSLSASAISSGGHQNTPGGMWDAFLVKFDPSGVRQWGSYYGGAANDFGYSCAVDASGNVLLAGSTTSTSAISSAGHQNSYGGGVRDAFLVKFNASGVRLWGTYYGGEVADGGADGWTACTSDGSGNVYLASHTSSASSIAANGHQNTLGGSSDAFLAKFSPDGVRYWGTYYGGDAYDSGKSCAVDANGNVYMTGSTASASAIAAGGHQNTFAGFADAFLVKFNSDGVRSWGTYYGGSGNDGGYSCALDAAGNVYLSGYAESASAISSMGHQNAYGGATDAFLVKFADGTSGVDERVMDRSFELHPNPAVDLVTITCSDPLVRVLEFRNALGEAVHRAPFKVQLDLAVLARGVYIVLALDRDGRPLAKTKFIKQ